MEFHANLEPRIVLQKIRARQFNFAGNKKLNIYGTLSCGSGKRIKRQNRIFFLDEQEAICAGFRPCGHCMKKAYQKWKQSKNRVGFPSNKYKI